ncbi:MAG: hypothetical protein ACFCUI_09550 [Bernardetiaceae bacterium]
MKKISFFFLIFLIAGYVYGQGPAVGALTQVATLRFDADSSRENTLLIPMAFSQHQLARRVELPEYSIRRVSIIYTDYPAGQDFSALNQRRIAQLVAAYPQLDSLPANRWQLIRQTDIATKEIAQSYFHGAMISWEKPIQITEKAQKAMKKIEEKYIYGGEFEDSVVFRSLERNKETWKNAIAVCDWTGSLYPYASQILHWHQLHRENDMLRAFVFFNDGNDTPDEAKIIGQTGGVYHASSQKMDEVQEQMLYALSGGAGGDGPENDIEAILKGIEAYPDTDFVILVADNNSSVRDIELYTQIKKPLRIILCGYEKSKMINPVYLNLARYTGGSIHTINQDILNLTELKANEEISIEGYLFKLDQDNFLSPVKRR